MFLIFRNALETAVLEADEMRHVRARRLKDGDSIAIGDGQGRRVRGILQGRTVVPSGPAESRGEADWKLFCAIPEPSRFDWMLQKCTELGVRTFVPLSCERSERSAVRRERSERIILEAASQSQRFFLPQLREPVSLAEAVRTAENAFVLDPGAAVWLSPVSRADFFVGPEGGFSAAETELLRELKGVRVSEHILRVETAAVAALARAGGVT